MCWGNPPAGAGQRVALTTRVDRGGPADEPETYGGRIETGWATMEHLDPPEDPNRGAYWSQYSAPSYCDGESVTCALNRNRSFAPLGYVTTGAEVILVFTKIELPTVCQMFR
jgi:hypothetical protein